MKKEFASEVTIIVQAYNQLNKLENCIKSIQKYTQGVDYDIILIDNGSTEPVYEYFKSLNFEKKRIIRVDHNVNSGYPATVFSLSWLSSYYIVLAADMIVTNNWLQNMMKIMTSDPTVGAVNPMSNNVSNRQNINFKYSSIDEMQEIATVNNESNPVKWEERARIVTLGTLYRKEMIEKKGWPLGDTGFFHDFTDDDIAFQIRRAGYKVVVAGDVWICHDHNFKSREKDANFINSINTGKKNFRDKYYGVDAWDDCNGYIRDNIIEHFKYTGNDKISILGINCGAGMEILEIKNMCRYFGVFDAKCSAFTIQDKFVTDLHTICDESVICDREEYFDRYFPENSFDYIVIGKPINSHKEMMEIVKVAYSLLKKNGQLFINLYNKSNALILFEYEGLVLSKDIDDYWAVSLDSFMNRVRNNGIPISLISLSYLPLGEADVEYVKRFVGKNSKSEKTDACVQKLLTEKYWLLIEK